MKARWGEKRDRLKNGVGGGMKTEREEFSSVPANHRIRKSKGEVVK